METQLEKDKPIQDYIDKMGFTWTVEGIKEQYVKYCNREYISFTARQVINNCKEELE